MNHALNVEIPYIYLPPVPAFELASDEFENGGTLPLASASKVFGAGGEDESPQLSWSGFPGETKSFALTCYDPDAPTGSGFWHWAVFNIPVRTTTLVHNAGGPNGGTLPSEAVTLRGDAGLAQYIGAGPPPGHGPHRYVFAVHAVDSETLEVASTSSPAYLGFTLFGHTLGRGVLVGMFER